MDIKTFLQNMSSPRGKFFERVINTYLLVLFAIISVTGLGYMLFREVQYIVASAPCPDELKSPITSLIELDSSDYASDNVIDCSAVDIQIQDGGILRILPRIVDNADDSDDFGLQILANSLTIDQGGLLDLEGQGYGPGIQADHAGSGKSSVTTCSSGTCGGSGGGHGGAGGRGDPDGSLEAGEAGEVYGNRLSPVTLGSGGGESATGASGGAGGGAVQFVVDGTLTLNGIINANGLNGTATGGSGAGGGAGGSVWIEADGFAGSGSVTAHGGDGGVSTKYGGGGGGGRVAMRCTSANTFTGTVTVSEGTGGIQDGQVGTLVGPSCYPLEPTEMRQLELTNPKQSQYLETEIVDGERTKKVNMVFRFKLADIENSSTIYPQIELREVGEAFTGVPNYTGSPVDYVGTPIEGMITVYGLTKTKEYKWQARGFDGTGIAGPWVEYEEDDPEEIDFIVLGDPANLTQVSGDGQTGTVGQPLADPFIVELQDAVGHTIPDETISWEVKAGEGVLSEYHSITDTNGQVQTTLTLGTDAGTNNNKVNAIRNGVVGSPMAFFASADPGTLHHYQVVAPSLALINTDFSPTVKIRARDEFENLIPTINNTVNLSAVLVEDGCPDVCNPGSGTLSPSQATLSSGEVEISNMQYDQAEAIYVKADDGSITGYSNSVNVVLQYGDCFDVANIPENSPLVINEDKIYLASPLDGGVINCSNIDVTVETGYTVELRSLELENGNYTDEVGVTLIAKSLTVEAGATMTADGWGYGEERGPGNDNTTTRAGGSHGGWGAGQPKEPYGNVYEPVTLGSAGSLYKYWGDATGRSPGAGGGAIKLEVTNTLTIDGLISSNGMPGYTDFSDSSEGAGGSIWINTDVLTGTGEIRADGGSTGNGTNDDNGGGGGRIAIEYSTESFGTGVHNEAGGGMLHAYGGQGDGGEDDGGPGTIYIEQKGVDPDEGGYLYIDNNADNTNPAGIVEGEYSFTKIEMTRYGHLDVLGNGSVLNVASGSQLVGDTTVSELDVKGTVNYTGGDRFYLDDLHLIISGEIAGVTDFTVANTSISTLTLNAHTWARSGNYTFGDVDIASDGTVILAGYDNKDDDWTNDYGINFNVTNLDVQVGGTLSADGKGFYARNGPGYAGDADGAGYGGYGGSGSINQGGVPYGSVYEPTDLGSGGHYDKYAPGNGGGAITLLSDVLQIDGLITANGIPGRTDFSDSSEGSGGSIWIRTDTIAGSGEIRADGGSTDIGSNTDRGGGGGRIAIEYVTDNFGAGLLNEAGGSNLHAYGGHGDGGLADGGAGTIYIEQTGVDPDEGAYLFVDNQDIDGNMAGLPEDDYEFIKIQLTRYGHLQLMGYGSNVYVSDPVGLQGDNTSIFEIIGTIHLPDTVEINNMTVAIYGDIASLIDGTDTSNMNVTVGSLGKLRLYAEAWGCTQGLYEFDTFNIESNGVLYINGYDDGDAEWEDDYGITLDTNDLTIAADGLIDGVGLGYPVERGPGAPGSAHANERTGGSYGGFGGQGDTEGQPADPYGSVYTPYHLGSSGGGSALHILTENLDLQGTATIDVTGSNHGSGGSVLIETGIFRGDGFIHADGGNPVNYSGGPAGGRIAIYYEDDLSSILSTLGTGTPKITAYGKDGRYKNYNDGGAGTIYVEHSGIEAFQGANLYIDDDSRDEKEYAGLPEADYEFSLVKLTRNGHLKVLGQDSTLTVTGSNSVQGDDTSPELAVEGTFNAPQIFNVNEYVLDIQGEIQLGADTSQGQVTIGDTAVGGLRLRANTWAHDDTNPYAFAEMTVAGQGTMYLHSYHSGDRVYDDDYGFNLSVDTLDILSGGLVTAEGLGYPTSRYGPGAPGTSTGGERTGASHGGFGGYGDWYIDTGDPYDNVYEPVMLGSSSNSNGGGAIKLTSNIVNVDGELNVDGTDSGWGGGGSGGALWIDTDTIDGDGLISANGGDRGRYGGSGAGGRIAIYYDTDNSSLISSLGTGTPLITAYGGGAGVEAGGAGTIYVEQNSVDPFHAAKLYIDNNDVTGADREAALTEGTWEFSLVDMKRNGDLRVTGQTSNLILTGSNNVVGDSSAPELRPEGTFTAPQIFTVNGYTLDVLGELALGVDTSSSQVTVSDGLTSGLRLYANTWAHDPEDPYTFDQLYIGGNGTAYLYSYNNGDNYWSNDFGFNLVTDTLTVDSNGTITADGLGYSDRDGPGYSHERTGASHGGYGGIGDHNVVAPPTYGDLYQPTDLGSGSQSAGGGAIKIDTASLKIDGMLSANGDAASSRASGSGGSIWLNTAIIDGSGTIAANAGAGNRYSGGGGGGRVAVYYETNNGFTFDSTHLQATGAHGYHTDGGPGTVYVEHVGTHEAGYGDLFIDNASFDPDSYGMDFYPQTYTFNNVTIGGNAKLRMMGETEVLPEGVVMPDEHGISSSEDGLVALWHFDETADDSCPGGEDVCDSSGNEFHGISMNGAEIDIGRFGNGRLFDGVDDYIDVGNIGLSGNDPRTIEAWFYPRVNETYMADEGGIFNLGTNDGSDLRAFVLVVRYNDCGGDIGAFYDSARTCTNTSLSEIGINQWHHIAITHSGIDQKIYLDGDLIGQSSYTTLNTEPGVSAIGKNFRNSREFDGYIDEVAVFDKVLTATEIKAHSLGLNESEYLSSPYGQRVGQGVTFDLTGNFALTTGAILDGQGFGFEENNGPQPGGIGPGENGGGGGGHGGAGGLGQNDTVNSDTPGGDPDDTDSSTHPTHLASGGGTSGTGSEGGKGGSAVTIKSTGDAGTVTIDGTIDVSGFDGGVVGNGGGGGGAGGSIYLEACDIFINASAVLDATGGNGGVSTYTGGGGGGGIIALGNRCSDTLTIDPGSTIDVDEGSGYQAGGEGIFGLYSIPQLYAQDQYTLGDAQITVGDEVEQRAVKFVIQATDPDVGTDLRPEVEVQYAGDGTSFDGTNVIQASSAITYNGSPIEVEIIIDNEDGGGQGMVMESGGNVLGITEGDLTYGEEYKWRARVYDVDEGVYSDWAEFGDNNDGVDFQVAAAPTCGNGVVEFGEECDGSDLDGETCSSLGHLGGTLQCTGSCTFDEGPCYEQFCGDGDIHGTEECDGANLNGETCQSLGYDAGTLSCDSCSFSGCYDYQCGNGVLEPGEQCDDDDFGGLSCTDFDEFDSGTLSCNASCVIGTDNCQQDPECGNNVLESGEQCDDGNTADGDGCSSSCVIETITYCGDGVVQPGEGEQCDDGNSQNGDGCSNTCQLEAESFCGDGTVDAGEQCDDGNQVNGDGCSNACIVEQEGYCGDGSIQGSEECDDGNQESGDGCSATCISERGECGNGILEYGEQCDGDDVGDQTCEALGFDRGIVSCSDSCTWVTDQCEQDPECGNGVVEPGEQCDGGIGDSSCEDFFGYIGGTLSCSDQCQFDFNRCERGEEEDILGLPLTGMLLPITGAVLTGGSIILAIISLILAFPSLLKKDEKKPWGLVYDERTNKPVAFAVVRLYRNSKIVAEKVTDLQGRYGFAVEDGKYDLEVKHEKYKVFKVNTKVSKELAGTVNRDVALKSKRAEVTLKDIKAWLRSKLSDAREQLPRISQYLYVAGFIFAVIATIISPVVYNLLVIIFYVVVGVVYVLRGMKRGWGRVYDGKTNEGIEYAFVRVFDSVKNKMLDNQITEKNGRYMFVIKPGTYNLLATKKGYKFPSKKQKGSVKKAYFGSLVQAVHKEGEKLLAVDLAMDKVGKREQDLRKLKKKTEDVSLSDTQAPYGTPFGK